MPRRAAILSYVTLVALLATLVVLMQVSGWRPRPGEATSRDVVRLDPGRRLFQRDCWSCHGTSGRGDGPVARFLPMPPLDFTLAQYKIRSTPHGELPTDQDLFYTITRGIPGTHMAGWKTLSERERWQLVAQLKKFSNFSRAPVTPTVFRTSPPPPRDDAVVQQGKTLFEEGRCWLCHGKEGRGDGPITAALVRQWAQPWNARNLTDGDSYKGGSTTEDIFRTLNTGFNGTPMGPQNSIFREHDLWRLAEYVARLAGRRLPRSEPLETGVSWQRGRWTFFGMGRCIHCHKVERKGIGSRGPDLSQIGLLGASRRDGRTATAYIFESITQPAAFQSPGYPNAMPQINRETIFLEPDEIHSLVVYLASQGQGARPDAEELARLPAPRSADREASRRIAPPGDPERGWQAFRSEPASCIKCHTVHGLGGRIGPSLTNISSFQSAAQVRASLLTPDNVLSYGFRRAVVAFATGQMANGALVEQDAREIRLSDSQGNIQVIPREGIEELVVQDVSPMPSDIAQRLTGAAERDVIAFLSDQYPALAASLARPGPPHFANPLTRLKNGPPLRDVLAKVDRRWIASWLKNPQSHDANTFMPNLSLGSEDMDAIIAYLSDVARPVARRNEWDATWSKLIDQMSDQELEILDRRLLEGKRLWSESRCTICHGVGGRPGEAAHAPALTRAAVKLLPDWLPGWLEDPQSHFPTTWMPRFAFTDRERASLAVYLLRGDEFGGLEADSLRGGGSPPPSPAALASQGRDVITRNRCVVCHDVPGIEEVLPPQPPSIEPRDEFERLVRDTRCLTCHRIAPEPPTEALTLAARRAPPGSAESTRFGGTFAPDLTTAGSRLRRDWIEKFLVAPDVIRPLLKQMPKLRLTGEQARMAADYLKQNLTDPRIHPDFLRDFAPAADELELGRKIYDAKGCIACHQMGPTGGAIGPTLTAAADRLEPGYTYEHLRNPQRLWPDVVEPNYGLTNREAMELTRFLHRRTSTRDSASRVARERVQTVMNNEQRTMNNGQLGMNNGD